MKKQPKQYNIQINGRNNSTRTTTGTVEELAQYFGYDAATGNGYSGKSIELVQE